MKFENPGRNLVLAFLLGVGAAFSVCSVAGECGVESYASPTDYSSTYPLSKPSMEFSRMLAAAKRGNALEQRNLAVSYEGGYLVSKCLEKAAGWYRRAASGGDEVAQKWVADQNRLNQLAAGPECIGSNCYIASSGPQVLTLNADSHGHFHIGVSINGVEVIGMIDTGASLLALSQATANSMGITAEGSKVAGAVTANGNITTFNKMVPSVRIGDIVLDNVEISISEKTPTLIGMSVLKRFNITESNGQMILSR